MTCPTCNRATFSGCVSGFVLEDDRPVACPELYAALRLKKASGGWPIPAKFHGAGIGYFPPESGRVFTPELQAAHRAAREYVARLGQPDALVNLYLAGTPGTGKSHLAAGIVYALQAEGRTAIFAGCADLGARLRAAIPDEAEESVPMIVEALTEADLLVMDDLGEERTTDFIEEQFYLILKRRLENERPVVITTNLSGDVLKGRIGDGIYRLLDRMRDRGTRIRLQGESLRGKQKENAAV